MTFTLNEMENALHIGRMIEALRFTFRINLSDEEDKEIFLYAMDWAQLFELECPDSENYYEDLEKFVVPKIMKKWGNDNTIMS